MIIWDVQHLKGIAAASCNNSYTQVYICILLSSKKTTEKSKQKCLYQIARVVIFFEPSLR